MKCFLLAIFTVFVSVGSGIKPIPPSDVAVDPPAVADILVDPTPASTTDPEVATVPYYACCYDCIRGPRPSKMPLYPIAYKIACPPSPTEQLSDTGTLFIWQYLSSFKQVRSENV